MSEQTKRVVVGMSGGVDSSVCVLRLQQEGYHVIGVTCLFSDDSASRQAIADAQAVARVLNVEHHVFDATDMFSSEVVQPFIDQFAAGLTPSPCVGCNKRCKIPALMAAADAHDCQYVATGHYARVVCQDGRYCVAPSHTMKDQSYMLALLTQEQLARLVLPLGDITKDVVRQIADEAQLPVAHKADSQDICFIEGSHLDFLRERGVTDGPGNFVTRDGKVVGQHTGLFQYTLGQRKGLGIGGAPEPYYVIEKRAQTNEVVVGFAREASMTQAYVDAMTWQAFSLEQRRALCEQHEGLKSLVKLRYRQNAVACTVYIEQVTDDGDCVRIELDDPMDLTAPGQFAVVYGDDVVLGGGMIVDVVVTDKKGA